MIPSSETNFIYTNPFYFNGIDLIANQQLIIFYYNPVLHYHDTLIDSISSNYSLLCPHTDIWSEKSVMQGINIVGGINVLLPLLTYVKRIIINIFIGDDTTTSLFDIFSLLASLLDNNWVLGTNMIETNAANTMGLLLRNIPIKYLDEEGTVESVINLIITTKNQTKLDSTLISVLFNFSIWKHTAFETQKRFYDNLINIITENGKTYVNLYSWTQYFLDNIRQCYFNSVQPVSVYGNWHVYIYLFLGYA